MSKHWIEWAKKLQAIAQNGLAYSKDEYDIERFNEIQKLAAEIISKYSSHTHSFVDNIFSSQQGYATPKIDVRGVIFKDDEILLVKERSDRKWTLPGGWADVSLSASENVVKEVEEETGYQVKVKRLLAVYDREKHPHIPKYLFHIYKMFFLCEIIGGSPQSNLEIEEIQFFKKNMLPELSLRRVTEEQINRMYKLRTQSITEFD